MWLLFAVSIIIASRSEPPGWMIAVTPARAATSMPSGNGKYASAVESESVPAHPAGLTRPEAAADDRMAGAREDLEVLSLPQDGQSLVLVPGSDDRLVEGALHRLGELAGHDPVRSDDAAERRHRIAHEGAAIGLRDLVVRCDAAGILVLDDRNGRLREVGRDTPRRVDDEHVVEACRLPV